MHIEADIVQRSYPSDTVEKSVKAFIRAYYSIFLFNLVLGRNTRPHDI